MDSFRRLKMKILIGGGLTLKPANVASHRREEVRKNCLFQRIKMKEARFSPLKMKRSSLERDLMEKMRLAFSLLPRLHFLILKV